MIRTCCQRAPEGIFINFILPITPQKPIDKESQSYMKNISLFLLLLFLCVCIGNAQETVIKHTVSKGETVFQLSRKYNVSPEEIYALNPSARDVIKIDEVLSIPKSDSPTNTITTTGSSSNILTYAVVYGDTKYSLARRYGISVEELERQNPHTKKGLQAGHILKIYNQKDKSSTNANYTIKKTHLVLKGETLWGISKQNDLKVEELVNANSDILTGILQIGQVLNIPNPYHLNVNDSGDTYVVQHGDTKYGLSKKYDVTIEELERTNPQIVRMLMTGQTIRIPNETTVAVNESSDNNNQTSDENTIIQSPKEEPTEEISNVEITEDVEEAKDTINVEESPKVEESKITIPEVSTIKGFVNYEVQPKETLYGLSKKAEMSISDFVALNPELANGVKVGMIIKMPSDDATQTPTLNSQTSANKKTDQKYVDLSQSINAVRKNQILLFLPFSESQYNTEYTRNISFKEVSNDFLREHLEFYRGVKIAQDSARALGLDFNIKIVETGTSKRNTKAAILAKENTAEDYDALILPFYETDNEEVAKLVRDKNIPLVTVSTITQENGLKNIYNAVPSTNSQRDIILDYISSKRGNLIVVCDIGRKESKAYISSYAPNAKFIEVNKKGTFNEDELESQLDANKVNYVILESEKNSVFLSTTNVLLGQLSNYSIQLALLDKSLIPSTNDVSNKRFVILQLLYPSLTPLNETSFTSNFVSAYKKSYSVEPTQNVKFGFDLTFDTLLRLSQEKSFEASAESDLTEYTNLKFDYKINTMGSHDNDGIYIIQYNTDGSLKEIN